MTSLTEPETQALGSIADGLAGSDRLDEPTAGRIRVNGRDYRAAPAPMAELGILLEAKAMHTGRSARNHLPRFGARPRQRVRSLA